MDGIGQNPTGGQRVVKCRAEVPGIEEERMWKWTDDGLLMPQNIKMI